MPKRAIAALIFIALTIIPSLLAQSATVEIIGTPSTEIDNAITLRARVLQGSKPLSSLSTTDFSVSEQSAEFTVTETREQPVILAVVINPSFWTPETIQSAQTFLQGYVNRFPTPDDDRILVDNGSAVSTVTKSSLPAIMDNFSYGEDTVNGTAATRVIQAVNAAHNELPYAPIHILLIGTRVNNNKDITAAVDSFTGAGYPVHIVYIEGTQQYSIFRELSQKSSGGTYLRAKSSSFYDMSDSGISLNNAPVFKFIDESRSLYTIRYQALSTAGGTRQVTLTGYGGSATFAYEPRFSQPEIKFEQANFNIARSFQADGSLMPGSQDVKIRVSFAGPLQRTLTSLNLLVFENGSSSPSGTFRPDSLVPDNDVYTIVWSLDSYKTPETSTTVQIQVVATDSTGQTVSSDMISAAISVGKEIEPIEPGVHFEKTNTKTERNFQSDGSLDDPIYPLTLQFVAPKNFTAIPKSARVIIYPGEAGEKEVATLSPISLNADKQFTINWDISDYKVPQTDLTIPIKVDVTLDDGKTLTTQSKFTVIVGEEIPITPWVFCRTIGITSCPLTADADMPSILVIVVVLFVAFALYLRTDRGRRQVKNVTQAIATSGTQVIKQMTMLIGGGGGEDAPVGNPLAEIEWNDRSTGQSGKITMMRPIFMVGREANAGSDGVISSPSVSAQHVRFTYDGHRFTLEDMHSSNGTRIRNRVITPGIVEEIHNDDRLQIGLVTAVFRTLVSAGAGSNETLYPSEIVDIDAHDAQPGQTQLAPDPDNLYKPGHTTQPPASPYAPPSGYVPPAPPSNGNGQRGILDRSNDDPLF